APKGTDASPPDRPGPLCSEPYAPNPDDGEELARGRQCQRPDAEELRRVEPDRPANGPLSPVRHRAGGNDPAVVPGLLRRDAARSTVHPRIVGTAQNLGRLQAFEGGCDEDLRRPQRTMARRFSGDFPPA